MINSIRTIPIGDQAKISLLPVIVSSKNPEEVLFRVGIILYKFRNEIAKLLSVKEPFFPKQQHFTFFSGGLNYDGISIESLRALQKSVCDVFVNPNIVEAFGEGCVSALQERGVIRVFPGGTCSRWDSFLTKEIQRKLYNEVRCGGKLLGVCAGGYYCSERSEYAINVNQVLKRVRPIALFPGLCQGPAFSSEVKVVKIKWLSTQQEGHVVVIGGGIFIPDKLIDPYKEFSFEIMARYLEKPHVEAIATVKCRVGKGTAILSALHLEFGSADLEIFKKVFPKQISEIEEMQEKLKRSESFRQACLKELLAELVSEE